MNTIILIERGRVQLVLKPENDHDKEVVKILERLPNTERTDLYQRKGGYTAFGYTDYSNNDGKDLMIIFDEPDDKEKN